MDKKYIFSIYIGIGLSAIASIPWHPLKETWIPILLISIFAIFTIVLIIKYLKSVFSFKIIFDKDEALKQAQQIFESAKVNGGELYATHIYPVERLPNDRLIDMFDKVSKKLSFHRLIYTDDPIKLDQNVRSTFEVKSDFLDVELLVPSTSNFLPKFIWYTIPRINILSYYDSTHKTAMTSIGLFRIFTKDNSKDETIPISPTIHIFSRNLMLFSKIKEYFRAFNHGHFSHIHSIEEYERVKKNILLQAKFRSFLAHLLVLCDDPKLGIINVSLFGQYASYRKGIFDIGNLRVDYDIDLIVVCEKGKKELIQSQIISELQNIGFDVKLIWGPINDDFYSVRTSGPVYVDIELFEDGDEYYKTNSLLGHSIIPTCVSIFMQDEEDHRLYNLLVLPEQFHSINERAEKLLNNRKGLIDFKNSISKYNGQFDPVRVISHIIRNTTWVLTGHFEPSYDKAFELIKTTKLHVCDRNIIKEALNVVKNSKTVHINDQLRITSILLDQTIDCMKKLEKTRNNLC